MVVRMHHDVPSRHQYVKHNDLKATAGSASLTGVSVINANVLTDSGSILETILATSPVGLGVLDRDLRFVRVNDALARGNGVPRAQHLGRTIMEVWPTIPPELVERLRALVDG